MSPINLGIRFLLEMSALVTLGVWGWNFDAYPLNVVFAIGLPILGAGVWGIFNVIGDPSRSGNAPVVVSGIVRLAIELTFFSVASWMIYDSGYAELSIVFLIATVLHYIASHQRIKWLLVN